MVMRSDFIEEDVELDERWERKRSESIRDGFGRGAEFLSGQIAMFTAIGFFLARLAFVLLILYIACTSLHKHGGFWDFGAWLCVAAYAIGRIKAQILGRVERDRRNAANL